MSMSRMTRPRSLTLRLAVAGLFALSASGACKPDPPPTPPPPEAPPPPPAPTLESTADEIFEAWFGTRPVTATSYGDHRFDGQWPDLTADALSADQQRITDALGKLAALDASAFTPDQRVDFEILSTELARQQFMHDVERPWRRDPLWYTTAIGNGLEDLVSRDYAPVGERAAAVASRLEGLPAFVEQALANLVPGETLLPHAQVAAAQLGGISILINQIIPARLSTATQEERDRVTAASEPAVASVLRLQQAIEADLLPEATNEWRLGADNFETKLKLTLHTDVGASELRRKAILEHARVRSQMHEIASELAQVLFKKRQLRRITKRASGDKQSAVIAAVLEELAAWHVEPPRLRDTIEAKLQRLQAFVDAQGLVTTDPQEVLEVIWTPPHQRGVFIAGLAAPGPLDASKPGLPSFYLVQPVPLEWSDDVRESFLREYNNQMLDVLSIHEAIPGHFVQQYYAKREPSKIRRILANGAFVEGWAVYAERFMIEAGFSGAPPDADDPRLDEVSPGALEVLGDPDLRAKALQLHALKFYLRTVTNAILDHSVHAGAMTQKEAIELMVRRSFQQEGEARGKWVRAQVTSGQLSTYFVGAQGWLELREQARARAAQSGETFDQRAFHDEALSHGAPPVHMLPELMWTPPAQPQAEPAEPTLGGEAAAPAPDVSEPAVSEEPAADEPVADEPVADDEAVLVE